MFLFDYMYKKRKVEHTHFLVVFFPSLGIINLSSWSWILLISLFKKNIEKIRLRSLKGNFGSFLQFYECRSWKQPALGNEEML